MISTLSFRTTSLMKAVLLTVGVVIWLGSCAPDEPSIGFDGPSEYTILFDKTALAGQSISLIHASTTVEDVNFISSRSITKVYAEPIEMQHNNKLNTQSFINWAWDGGTVVDGSHNTTSVAGPGGGGSGDILLAYENGDEYNMFIPAYQPVTLSKYGEIGEEITGSFSFTGNIQGTESGKAFYIQNCKATISFRLKRGKDQ